MPGDVLWVRVPILMSLCVRPSACRGLTPVSAQSFSHPHTLPSWLLLCCSALQALQGRQLFFLKGFQGPSLEGAVMGQESVPTVPWGAWGNPAPVGCADRPSGSPGCYPAAGLWVLGVACW